jgi:acid phosphatase type 7
MGAVPSPPNWQTTRPRLSSVDLHPPTSGVTVRSLLVPVVAAVLGFTQLACSSPEGVGAPTPSVSTHASSARAGATAVTVVAAGDIACPPGEAVQSDGCQQAATATLVGQIDPDHVLVLGDAQYESGRLRAFRRSYAKSWGDFRGRTLPVPGNHEYNTSGASGYFTYFGSTAPGYRAVNVGAWRIYLLNGNCDQIDCAAERTWMRQDMDAHPTDCSAITVHFPRYSSGPHGSTTSMTRFWKIALRHGVDLALAGHDHDYERFAPMDASGHRVSDGILSFVVGTGGKSLYQRASHPRGSRYFSNDAFGVLALTLDDGSFSWEFRAVGGAVRDPGSHACH